MRRLSLLLGLVSMHGCANPPPPEPPPPPPAPPRADVVLLVGGAAPAGQGPVSAVAVQGPRIAAVGTEAELAAWIGPDTRVLHLPGGVVVPGLVDAHMHLMGLGKRRLTLDLAGTRTLAEVKAKVAAAAARATPGAWILGRGWDQNDWSDQQGFPSAEDLDPVSGDHPVALTRVDGHALWVNTAALRRAGVTAKSRPAAGGRVVMKHGIPTGIFVDNAMALIRDHVPAPGAEELRQAVLRAQEECLAAGLTEVHDMGVTLDELAVLRALDAQGALRMRVYAAHDGTAEDLTPALAAPPTLPALDGPHRLTVRAVKFYADGALGSRGAALLEDYSDDAGNQGLLLTDPAVLEARVRSAHAAGYQVATHAIGDRANMAVLDVYRRVFGARAWRARPRIEHAQVLAEVDLPRFGQEGVIASLQPTHATSDMPWAQARLGPERVKGAYAWHSLLTRGATVAAGSDAPVEEVAPLLGLYAAVTRQDRLGLPEGGWRPEEAMSGTEALAAFTTGARWAAFEEERLGRLEAGYLADLTVLSVDPTTASPDAIATAQALLTMVGGEVLYLRPGAEAPRVDPVTTSTRAE